MVSPRHQSSLFEEPMIIFPRAEENEESQEPNSDTQALSESLEGAQNAAIETGGTKGTQNTSSPPPSLEELEARLGRTRQYSIDLNCRMLLSRGAGVDSMVRSNTSRSCSVREC